MNVDLANTSKEFRSFYESLKWLDPRDGPEIDIASLRSLSGLERDLAENILIERIETQGNCIMEVLAEMKSQKGAVALKKFVKDAGGVDAVHAALALWRIEKWPKAQSIMIAVLEGRRKYFPHADLEDFEATGRAEAARALAYIPDSRTREALLRALDDSHANVRYWAAIALNVVAKADSRDETNRTS